MSAQELDSISTPIVTDSLGTDSLAMDSLAIDSLAMESFDSLIVAEDSIIPIRPYYTGWNEEEVSVSSSATRSCVAQLMTCSGLIALP